MPSTCSRTGGSPIAECSPLMLGATRHSPPGAPPRSNADGLVTDDDGRLYALTESGIEVLSPTGQHLGVIPLRASRGAARIWGSAAPTSARFTWPVAARCCGFQCSHADFRAAQSEDIPPP